MRDEVRKQSQRGTVSEWTKGVSKKKQRHGRKIERRMEIDEGPKREFRSSDVEHPHA